MNILVYSPLPNDATSFYRAGGVLPYLRKLIPDFHIMEFKSEIGLMELANIDLVFLQRPFKPEIAKFAAFVKKCNIPLWIDYDDDLFHIPEYLEIYHNYHRPVIRQSMVNCCQLADVITVTTQALKDVLSQLNQNVKVVPNAINDYLFKFDPKPSQKRILWRGSDVHLKDLEICREDLQRIKKEFPDYVLTFMGYRPPFLENVEHFPVMEIIDYFRILRDLAPEIVIVPLIDNEMNRSVSNINALEGVWAGATVIAPDWPEWEKLAWGYDGSIFEAVEYAIGMKKDNPKKYEDIKNKIFETLKDFNLSEINKQRMTILKQCTTR